MYNNKLRKLYAGCAAAMALTLAAGPISAFAAPPEATPAAVNTVNPGTTSDQKEAKKLDKTTREAIDPTAKDDPATDDKNEAYVDTKIDVWAFTEDETVYSVDVEWGAMTFEYEKSRWDPKDHKSIDGRGWMVYDNEKEEVITATQDAINRVTVTNHSNAAVYAKLSYTPGTDYGDTKGKFIATSDGSDTDPDLKSNSTDTKVAVDAETSGNNGFIKLSTANNGRGSDGAGEATVGNVYFKPDGITANQTIDKWNTIGKITVAITTTNPDSGVLTE